MRRLVGKRLPRFTSEEAKELKGSFDFIGLNYCTTYFTINNPHPPNPRHTDYILDARANVSCKIARLQAFHILIYSSLKFSEIAYHVLIPFVLIYSTFIFLIKHFQSGIFLI